MQFQRNKLDISERTNIYMNKDNSNSNTGEMAYIEPIGNRIISPISIGGERSIDLGEKNKYHFSRIKPSLIQSMKNDIKNKNLNIVQLVEENPMPSSLVNIPYEDNIDYSREKSPRYLNIKSIRRPKQDNMNNNFNIRTAKQKRSPKQRIKKIKNNYKTLTNPQLIDSRNIINSSNDSGNYHQIIFDPRANYISRSPVYDRGERGGIIPFNNMSPNLNNLNTFEEMNSSEQKIDTNNNYNNTNSNKIILTSNSQRNISADVPNRYEKKININLNNNIPNNIQYINTNTNDISDEVNNKYKNKINQNMNYNDIKKIMRQFTKIYDPHRNSNGMLIESSQVIVPGASDDIFINRYKVLSKMNRLSNILLSKRKRSLNKYQLNSNLNKRSRTRTKSRSPFSIKSTERAKSNSPFMNKMPHNKFLYVSLAMMSSKGPNAEDRIILRKMRLDKGGVVDLAQEERKKAKYKIKKIMKNKNNINLYHTNPKYREIAAKIIQAWWKELKILCDKKLKKIILIQSVFRGKWVRKNMYDLLYLNYLYICFCRKIEKVLSNHVRPYVLDKLFFYKKAENDLLKRIIKQKEIKEKKETLLYYYKKWYSIIKTENKKNKASKQLVDIRSNKENKLNILLAFFNKWRYMTKISNIPPGKNYSIYPLNKINGLCKIMDAAKKYIQKKALKKIIKQLIKYLSNQLRNNLLLKIISKKREYIKNITRNVLYLWYSKILNYQKISNVIEKDKLRLMRQKIFRILILHIKRRINRRILRKYLIRFYQKTFPSVINKYIIYEILRKIKVEELQYNKEHIVNIKGKKYKIIKTKKDLKIIRAEEEDSIDNDEENKSEEQIVDNYEEIINKIKKRKSGEFKEGEEIPEDIKKDLDKNIIKKIKKEKPNEEEEIEEKEEKEINSEESEERPKIKIKPKKTKSETKKTKTSKRKGNKKQEQKEELTPSSSYKQEEENSDIVQKVKYRKKEKERPFSEKRDEQYKYNYNTKKRKSSPQSKRIIKIIRKIKEKTPNESQSEEYEEIEESSEERKPRTKNIYRRRSEPVNKRRHYPRRRIYDDNEERSEDSENYIDGNKRYIYIEEKPKRKKNYNKKKEEYDNEEEEDSPEKRNKRKNRYVYIRKDRDGNEYIEEEISSEEEEPKRIRKRKEKEKPYIRKRNKEYDYNNKIDEVEESEEEEKESIDLNNKKKTRQKEEKIDFYDEKGKKINNLDDYINEDGEYMIDLYDKDGNIINDLKKYIKKEKEKKKDKDERKKNINKLYDKTERRLIYLDKAESNEEKENEEEEEEGEESFDKGRKKISNVRKYKKEDDKKPIELYDKNGKKIINIEKHKTKDGYYTNIYDKNGKKIIDLQKYRNENGEYDIDIYDKKGKKINNLNKYKNKDGSYNIDLYDKEGRKLLDIKKYNKSKETKEENKQKRKSIKKRETSSESQEEKKSFENEELSDEENKKIKDFKKYKQKEKEKEPEFYDKEGNKINNINKYRNKEGDITIPIYDKKGNRIIDIDKDKNKIDIYDKNKKKINNINKYKNEDDEYEDDLYDKDGNKIIDIKKYKKEEKEIYDKDGNRLLDLDKYQKDDIDIYDKKGKIIKDLKKYINKEGELTIPIYDKNKKRIIDLKKHIKENGEDNNIYDKKGKIIKDIKKYENKEESEESEKEEEEEEESDINIYDKNGKKIKDIKEYINKEEEIINPIYDEDNRKIIDINKYKNEDGDINIDLYDKKGKKIKNINNHKNENGDITIDIYDKDGNRLLDLKKNQKKEKENNNKKNKYKQTPTSRYKINPGYLKKDLTKLSGQGEKYIPSYAKNRSQSQSKSKIKPITLIGNKTELGKKLEQHKNNIIQLSPKEALLLDLLNTKEQKLKLLLWKYFCIWRGNTINKYNELGDILKFIRGSALTNLSGDFIEALKSVKNPRLYSIALKKFLMNLFHKNIDLLRDAFNKWKKIVQKENINLLKSKFFYSLCKKNDKKNEEENDGVSDAINNVNNLIKKKKMNFNSPYPNEVKNILSLYFHKWKGDKNLSLQKYFIDNKIVSLHDNYKKYIFKKDKISESFIQTLLNNIPEKDKENFIKHPLRRMIVLRYRKERMHLLRFLLKWYNKVRLILAIEHLERIIKGREKLTKLMRYKPSLILYKKMKLMNPKFYKAKGEKLIKALLNISINKPYKKLINNMILFNRVNKLHKIIPKINEKVVKYLLKKYVEKWEDIVHKLKEQKIKILLTYIKKKIKDEKIINTQRKGELLKRFILNIEKNKFNKLLLAFNLWYKLSNLNKDHKSLIKAKEGNLITTINGEEKIIEGKDIKEGGEINITLIKNKQGEFNINDIINNNLTENERQEIIKKKIPSTFNLLNDKIKSLLQIKFYKWKNITNKIICDKNARTIQRFIRKKMGKLLWKKRNKFFADLSHKLLKQKINTIAKVYFLVKNIKKIVYKKLFDNLKHKADNKKCLIDLNDNLLNVKDDLINKNKKIALKHILKLYTYTVLKSLLNNLSKIQRNKSKNIFQEFINKLKQNKIKQSEYTYEKKLSSENIPFRKKLSFSKKKSSKEIPKIYIDNNTKSISYKSLLPHLINFLQEKILSRKQTSFNKLKHFYKSIKLNSTLNKYINASLIPDKKIFYKNLSKLSSTGEKQKELYKLLRKYLIKKLLFKNIEEPERILKLIYLIKISIINQEIADKRWIRVLIRKWRFHSFSRNISKKKMSTLYKNFHINYLEMVKDVFGEEKFDNPSVIKEFERFGASVGMWENENPDYFGEKKLSKNYRKKMTFHRPKLDEKKIENYFQDKKEMKEIKNIEEIKEDKKINDFEEKKEIVEDNKDNKEEPKEKRRYFRRNYKSNK